MMGILNRMERRNAAPESRSGLGLFAGAPSPTGVTITPEKALGLTAFWNGVRIISQTIAGLPLGVYESRGERREVAPEHPVHRLLATQPNPFMTPYTFKEIRQAHLLTWGNSYAEIERDGRGRPIALWPLLPDRSGIEVKNGRKVFFTNVDGRKIYLSADRVLHVPGLGFDGLRGYNVIQLFRDALGLTAAANEYGAQFFGNSGRPSGYLTTEHKVSKDELDRVGAAWNQEHSGLSRAQRTAVLMGGMEFKALSVPPEDAQFLETRSLQIDEVARILNINPILLQKTQGATTWGTAIGHFLTAFAKFTITPWVEREEDALNAALFGEHERGKYYTKFNVSALLRGDPKTQADVLEIERRNGVINADEWLALTDRNPLPDNKGQAYLVPLNMAPIEQMLERDPADLPVHKRSQQKPVERRTGVVRRRLREAFRSAFQLGASQFVRSEIDFLNRTLEAGEASGDLVAAFERGFEEFFPGHRESVQGIMRPLVADLAGAVSAEAFAEVNAKALEPSAFVKAYTQRLAERESGASMGQIRTALAAEAGAAPALRALASRWDENRARIIASRETVRVSSGAARWAWQQAGIPELEWRAEPDSCPLCTALDGVRVPVRGAFLASGESVGSGTDTLVASETIGGPPLHDGCECDIVPG